MYEELEIKDIKFSGWDWPVSYNKQEDQDKYAARKIWFINGIHVIRVT